MDPTYLVSTQYLASLRDTDGMLHFPRSATKEDEPCRTKYNCSHLFFQILELSLLIIIINHWALLVVRSFLLHLANSHGL